MVKFSSIVIFTILAGATAFAGFNHPEALGQWNNDVKSVDVVNLTKYPTLKVDCADPLLYPTHPSQNLKRYHVWMSAQYDETKVKADDHECRTPAPMHNRCLRADQAMHIVLSDTYQDSCGHFYRGFQQREYILQDDGMGTLVAAGRTIYPNPKGELPEDMIEGGTYAVNQKEFIKLGPLFPNDMKVISLGKAGAVKDFTFDGKLFHEK